MNNKILRSGILALCSLFIAAGLSAEPSPSGDKGSWEERHEEKIKAMHEKLGLTPAQEKALKAHRESHREEGKKLWQEVRGKRESLRQELQKNPVDEPKVRALHDELKALDAKQADHRFAGVLAVRKILTPEQFKKFQDLMEENRKSGEGRRGAKPHGGKPQGERREGPGKE